MEFNKQYMKKGFKIKSIWKGLNWPKWSILTVGILWETPLNIHFETNNERQDCKIGSVHVCEGCLWERGGWMEEMKVREYGWRASYTYMK
jgi:hypothetical protein